MSWFRTSNNDPFIVDATTIDVMTYSRALSNLPAGSTWGASANRVVGEALGYTDTHSVMYSLADLDQFYRSLASDDVNMLRMAQTGIDLLSGTTDDYTVNLVYAGECTTPSQYDVKVYLDPLPAGVLGGCALTRINYSFDPGNPFLARHFSMVRAVAGVPFEIILSDAVAWEFEGPIFLDGFETGDTSKWDAVTAAPGDLTPEEEALELELMQEDELWLEELEEEALLLGPLE